MIEPILIAPTFVQYDEAYWTYTTQLNDARLMAFIRAMSEEKPVSFQGKVYNIMRISIMPETTIVVLRDIRGYRKP